MLLAFLAVWSMTGAMIRGLDMARDIGLYMTLQNMFVFFDFEEPLAFFILDYLAVMGLFAWVGYYVARWLKRYSVRK